jgi:hypothetical protein
MTLGSRSQKAGSFAAQVVAAIAAVELPHGQWSDLIGVLLQAVNSPGDVNLKVSALQTIGFICEAIVSHFVLQHLSIVCLFRTLRPLFSFYKETGSFETTV